MASCHLRVCVAGHIHPEAFPSGPCFVGDKTATMPDSPTEVKTQPRSTPPGMPPPPPAASQGATRLPSFTPHTSE
uniref:Uncharacterized protein n=1 Tax=Ailuropoda melanoleuca TaxID=9646 RepID=A0A7N5J9G2_AILME